MESETTMVGRVNVRPNPFTAGSTLALLFAVLMVRQAHLTEVGVGRSPITQQLPTLKEELSFGLKARRPAELAFIDRVVTLVRNSRLPLVMVKSTFAWSRRQDSVFPFPYFENGLRLRAKRIGIKI